ncbi:MAG: sodium:calcium antiporter [Erysipelotrichaceae bacterium]|nr:sodium:calcium antiporter [Erysipelotrichaceae bacterium]
MIYLAYGLLAVLVVLFSIKLSQYVDALDKKTNLSGAFIGGVMLAAVTSLPELFTSLTAVLALDQPQLVQGDVLGSNVFNLCIIAVVILIAAKGYRDSQVSRSHKQTLLYGLIMYALVFLAIIKPITLDLGIINVNLMTILILLVYAVNVHSMKHDDSAENEEPCDLDLSVPQITVRFLLFSVALVLVSILLTQVTNIIAEDLNMGATVAGAIFLGVATSLPELSASLSLMRLGNFNASFGNVVGSNLFNFIIFCFADIIYTKGSIYLNDGQVMNLIGFGALSSVLALGFLYGKKHVWVLRILSVLILGCYVFSIVCSM